MSMLSRLAKAMENPIEELIGEQRERNAENEEGNMLAEMYALDKVVLGNVTLVVILLLLLLSLLSVIVLFAIRLFRRINRREDGQA